MDFIDSIILESLIKDAETPLSDLGKACGISSSSAISKRIKRMKEDGIIKKYEASLNLDSLGYEFITVTFIKAKFGEDYTGRLSKKLLALPGVITLLEILGEMDFVMIALSKTQKEYKEILSYLMSLEEIERSDTRVVINNYRMHDLSNIKIAPDRSDFSGSGAP